jgi:hypothetical protein
MTDEEIKHVFQTAVRACEWTLSRTDPPPKRLIGEMYYAAEIARRGLIEMEQDK